MKKSRIASFCLAFALILASCSNPPAGNADGVVAEYYLINGMGREIVSVAYVNVQSHFVWYGMRMPAGDTTMIFEETTVPNSPPSTNITLIRILESDSTTFIKGISAANDDEWAAKKDSAGNVLWYYNVH
jgi:hypothetical protein